MNELNDGPADGDRVANEDEVVAEFPQGDDRPLKEQRDLVDEDGEDIRQYTGEPVETDRGTVIPQQQSAGPETVGSGTPDPADRANRRD